MSFTLTFDPDDLDGSPWSDVLFVRPWGGDSKRPVRTQDGRAVDPREESYGIGGDGTFAISLPSAEVLDGYWVRYGQQRSWRVFVPAQPSGSNVKLTDPRWWPTAGTPPTAAEVQQIEKRLQALEQNGGGGGGGSAFDPSPIYAALNAEATRASGAEQANAAAISAHAARTDNPHGLTKTQIGLGAVDNTSDAAKPVSSATQTALDAKAPVVGGKIPTSFIPATAIFDVVKVSSQAAMLASGLQTGDVAIRTDFTPARRYQLLGTGDPTVLDNWELVSVDPNANVDSVNGFTGPVTLGPGDVGALAKSANLGDLPSAATGRVNLGLGSAATQPATAFATAAQGSKADAAAPQTSLDAEVQRAQTAEQANAQAIATHALSRLVVAAPGALTAGRTNVVTAPGSYDAPALTGVLTDPPQRFAIRNDGTQNITLNLPDGTTGQTLALTILPGMARVYRQVSTAGYGLEDGIPKAALDAAYQPTRPPQRRLRVNDAVIREAAGVTNNALADNVLAVSDLWLPGAVDDNGTPVASAYGTWWFEVSTAGSAGAVARIAIYSHDPIQWQPATLLSASDPVAITSTGLKSVTGLTVPVPAAGRLAWAGIVIQGGATTRAQVRVIAGEISPPVFRNSNPNLSLLNQQSVPQANGVIGAPAPTWAANGNGGSDVGYAAQIYQAARMAATRTA